MVKKIISFTNQEKNIAQLFVNWLFMYLEDDECQILADRISKWLKPKCQAFVRESCISASNPNNPHPHTYYRQPEFMKSYMEIPTNYGGYFKNKRKMRCCGDVERP